MPDRSTDATRELRECPRCGATAARRSRRRGGERLLSILGLFPFRCEDCGTRTLRFAPGELQRG